MSAMKKLKFKPKENYAIVDAKVVTFHQGKRLVNYYRSGQKLLGKVIERQHYML